MLKKIVSVAALIIASYGAHAQTAKQVARAQIMEQAGRGVFIAYTGHEGAAPIRIPLRDVVATYAAPIADGYMVLTTLACPIDTRRWLAVRRGVRPYPGNGSGGAVIGCYDRAASAIAPTRKESVAVVWEDNPEYTDLEPASAFNWAR